MSIDNGTYNVLYWTCASPGTARDVKARFTEVGISGVRLTVSGATGHVDALLTGTPECTRSIAQTISYPAPGAIALTSAAAFTCSATCPAAKCASGTQPVIVDTFWFEKDIVPSSTYVFTRTLTAVVGVPLAARCQVGDTETIHYQKL
jgi:hypothetical protein